MSGHPALPADRHRLIILAFHAPDSVPADGSPRRPPDWWGSFEDFKTSQGSSKFFLVVCRSSLSCFHPRPDPNRILKIHWSLSLVEMYFSFFICQLLAASSCLLDVSLAGPLASHRGAKSAVTRDSGRVKPKVFIIDMFAPEGEAWYGIPEFDVLAQNISVSGFSPLFPDAHCTADGEICQLVTGESGKLNLDVLSAVSNEHRNVD